MSRTHLERVLGGDRSARPDTEGRMYFVDPPPPGAPPTTGQGLPPPGTDVFTLHSRPGAHTRIYLDFDGAEVSNTEWNLPTATTSGTPSGFYPGYSTDVDPAFSATERDVVARTWAEVAEDDGTVQGRRDDRGPGGRGAAAVVLLRHRLRGAGAGHGAPTRPRPRCARAAPASPTSVCSTSPPPPRHPFPHQPAWVFASTLQNNPHFLADAVSHEVGHTFGLEHDGLAVPGQPVDPYYKQPGAWSPVMGAAYNPLTQWSDGDYPGADNHQDDLAVIAAHGAPLASDDHGGTPGTATALTGGPASETAGTIGPRGDVDVFQVPGCPSAVVVHVLPSDRVPTSTWPCACSTGPGRRPSRPPRPPAGSTPP